MKLISILSIALISIFTLSCSSDSANDDNVSGTEDLDFQGYIQTFTQSGDTYNHEFRGDILEKVTLNGSPGMDVLYDSQDRIIRLTEYTLGGVWSDFKFNYDNSGKMISVEELNLDDNFITRTISYSENKINIPKISNQGGEIVFTFKDDRITKFEDKNNYGTVIHSDTYSYDSNGNVIGVEVMNDIGFGQSVEYFQHNYDEMRNPLQDFYSKSLLPMLIFGSQNIFFRYKNTDIVKGFGPNNRIKTIYPEGGDPNAVYIINNEYDRGNISYQTLTQKSSGIITQTVEFLYND